jgi:hypothetical protein
MSIRHCGKARKTVSYWLLPNVDEKRVYRHIVLLSTTCPSCNQFVLEWHGIDHNHLRTPQRRIAVKRHDEWIARTQTDIDDQMDSSRWRSVKSGVYRVKASLRQFPWTPIMATVR